MYIARVTSDGRKESVEDHSNDTACFAARYAPAFFTMLAVLTALLHDAGKNTKEFLEYILSMLTDNKARRGEVIHSTAGAVMASDFPNNDKYARLTIELIRHAILSHHGLYDCVDLEGNETYQRRAQKQKDMDSIRQEVHKYISEEKLLRLFEQSKEEVAVLAREIASFCKGWPNAAQTKRRAHVGSKWFYFGMLERLLLSILINADRTASACFRKGTRLSEKEAVSGRDFWRQLLNVLEKNLIAKNTGSPLDVFRREISDCCLDAAKSELGIIRLEVPTGAGKTMSGLRLALQQALQFTKKRIFYVAPFNSILEQNAREMRDMLECGWETLLEHHSNLIPDDEDKEAYSELAESWSAPIIATSAVQFLNSLFSHKSGAIRRMHALCDSVIIIDEVQAIPVRCTALFNMAMNFLSKFCGSVIILCSATQPPFHKIPENSLAEPLNILPNQQRYIEAFRRTRIIDDTNRVPAGLRARDAAEYAVRRFDEDGSLLFVVNTKGCAKNIYREIKDLVAARIDKPTLIHLSTSMCPAHRIENLNKLRELLNANAPVICVSTQLIEAGVDISFRSVIRSLAGLPNIVQAAGRCNRHRETDCGMVYLIKIHKDDERLDMLPEIRESQEIMQMLLPAFKPDGQGGDMLSQSAMDAFYQYYYASNLDIINYPLPNFASNMVDLLSVNTIGIKRFTQINPNQHKPLLAQAFKTAGEEFQVIEEKGGRDVLVAYNEESKEFILRLNSELKSEELHALMPKLQKYSVSIYPSMLRRMADAFYPTVNGIMVLRDEYYCGETGVCEESSPMQPLFDD